MLINNWQRVFILHSRPYRETSLLLNILSEQSGKLTLMAKGARSSRSHTKGYLQLFTPLLMCWSGTSEIKLLRQVEAISMTLPLSGTILYSGFYVNELLMRILEEEVAYPELFLSYLDCIKSLALATDNLNIEHILRVFELTLLEQIGYGVDFLHCAKTGQLVVENLTYCYHEDVGFMVGKGGEQRTFTGQDLLAISKKDFSRKGTLIAAKKFTRLALRPHIGTRPLKSKELFRRIVTSPNKK